MFGLRLLAAWVKEQGEPPVEVEEMGWQPVGVDHC